MSIVAIFQELNLPLTTQVRQAIMESSSQVKSPATSDPYSTVRDSKEMVGQWKSLLSGEEVERIRLRVGDVANRYYIDNEW
jgi:hypothetical protein